MSNAMRSSQEKCGCAFDGEFGPNTAKGIAKHFDLTAEQTAHLLGQAMQESGGFKRIRENLNYSWEGLMRTWPFRFKTEEEAKTYDRQPFKISSKVYLRERLRNFLEADSRNFIGRGYLQLTGKIQYCFFASDMGVPEVLKDPSIVEDQYAYEIALYFVKKNGP